MRLPKQVEIIEVGPRDGFQNVRDFIETPQKIAIVDALAEAGFGTMEVTSFVHPKAIPQMADAEAVLTHARRKYAGRMKLAVLVPNLFGARKAVSLAVDEMSYVISASERHNLENTRQTVDQSLQALKEVLAEKARSSCVCRSPPRLPARSSAKLRWNRWRGSLTPDWRWASTTS